MRCYTPPELLSIADNSLPCKQRATDMYFGGLRCCTLRTLVLHPTH
jgi:hypothetical protein